LIVVPVGGVVPMAPDLRALVYAAVVLPMIAGLGLELFLPGTISVRVHRSDPLLRPTLDADSPSLP
jgi:hypothetical protein